MLRIVMAIATAALSSVLSCCHGFSSSSSLIVAQQATAAVSQKYSTTRLWSSTTSTSSPQRTAISMTLEELSDKLGGSGRSQLAWDCYSKGVDPHYLFSPDNEEEVDIDSPQQQKLFWKDEYKDKAKLKKQILPTPRQTQQLGSSALTLLSNLHSNLPNNDSGAIENGLATLVHMSPSSDGTTKLLIRLVDGYEVETVLIPFWTNNRGSRTTVCISSQVGCRQGCTFCATGKMGKLRSLTTDEILVQMFYAQKIVRLSNNNNHDYEGDEIDKPPPLPPITNVVFMGMGEPADAADSVRGAIKILTRNELFQLSATRVTVSTVAPTPDAFHEFVDSKCVLAWSVHAVRDELRRQLVPTTKYTMVELRQGLIDTLKKRNLRTTMVEVALIDGVNDSMREADELANFVTEITTQVPGSKLICNLIPYNDIGGGGSASNFRKPSMERVLDFQKRLQELGVYTHVRGTRGDDESAACGQLATSRKQKQKESVVY